VVKVRSRRPALLDAHDADFGEMRDWWIIDITFAIVNEKDTQEQENTSEDSGTATVYLLPTYLPPTGVDNGIH